MIYKIIMRVVSLSSLSHVQLFVTSWTAAHLEILKLMSNKSVMPSSHLILCHPLFLLPSIFSSTRVFSNESVLCIRWPKYWSFSISPSNEYSGLISFRMEYRAQETLKSFLQHRSSKVSSSALSFLYSLSATSIHDY